MTELIELLKGFKPMSEEEIAHFYDMPEGAIMHPDLESFNKACHDLVERNAVHQAGCFQDIGVFWTFEKGR